MSRPLILVDSSVWIDYFNGVTTVATDPLDALFKEAPSLRSVTSS